MEIISAHGRKYPCHALADSTLFAATHFVAMHPNTAGINLRMDWPSFIFIKV
jgi:hypothetical protein